MRVSTYVVRLLCRCAGGGVACRACAGVESTVLPSSSPPRRNAAASAPARREEGDGRRNKKRRRRSRVAKYVGGDEGWVGEKSRPWKHIAQEVGGPTTIRIRSGTEAGSISRRTLFSLSSVALNFRLFTASEKLFGELIPVPCDGRRGIALVFLAGLSFCGCRGGRSGGVLGAPPSKSDTSTASLLLLHPFSTGAKTGQRATRKGKEGRQQRRRTASS